MSIKLKRLLDSLIDNNVEIGLILRRMLRDE
jgi:hypothetical protein